MLNLCLYKVLYIKMIIIPSKLRCNQTEEYLLEQHPKLKENLPDIRSSSCSVIILFYKLVFNRRQLSFQELANREAASCWDTTVGSSDVTLTQVLLVQPCF